MSSNYTWSVGAQALLDRLFRGDAVGVPRPSYGSMAFGYHASAYLNSAVDICRDRRMSDYRIFIALYAIRHGVELWLKCLLRNELVDRGLHRMSVAGTSFDEIAKACRQDTKRGRFLLERALCAYRNYHEDGLVAPEMWRKKMGPAFADMSITFVRTRLNERREQLAGIWHLPIATHDLRELWTGKRSDGTQDEDLDARGLLELAETGMRFYSSREKDAPPLSLTDLDVVIEVLGTLDESGDAFRYPSSMSGEWHGRLPHMSLERLGELAEQLESTVRAWRNYYSEAYQFSTLAAPWPHDVMF